MTTAGPVIDPRKVPGFVRPATLSDALHLATDHGHTHLGFPEPVQIDYPGGLLDLHPRLLPSSRALRAGDVYVFSLAELVARCAGLPGGMPPGTGQLLELIGAAAASEVVAVTSFIPIAWTVPNLRSNPVAQQAHTRMAFTGIFGTAAEPYEIWSWGVNAAAGGPQDQAGLDAAATAMKDAWIARVRPLTTQNIVLTGTLYAHVNAQGHVLRFPDGSYQQGKKVWNSAGEMAVQGQLPLQTALVVSYSTPRPGPTGRGRSYLPFQVSQTIGADFRLGENYCTALAAAMTGLVQDLNGLGGRVSVVSNGSIKEPGVAGAVSPVTRVRVGRVPDTMRSRRNALSEGYISGPAIA